MTDAVHIDNFSQMAAEFLGLKWGENDPFYYWKY
jgi:hypothetical protein